MKDAQTLPHDLIRPPQEIFDKAAVQARIDAARGQGGSDDAALRKATVDVLKDEMTRGRAVIEAAFAQQPFAAHSATHSYTWLTDCAILTALNVACNHLHPLANPTESERIAVFAVGGYGRGEMAPFSDVDLLFLTPYKITPWAESVIESTLYILWDLKLKVGHASRTIRDCLRLGAEDFTIRTALLENRFLFGDAPLAEKLHTRLHKDLFEGSEREFIEAKLEERDERHRKQGG
ncbi:MAG: nucleotidyltransferase domain-containing protein, partial [Rhodobacteraceae bacterium]|nr:nucleotidyltransferase domain-containing protein [Paracoccaceae bacterium]